MSCTRFLLLGTVALCAASVMSWLKFRIAVSISALDFKEIFGLMWALIYFLNLSQFIFLLVREVTGES